MRYTALIIFLLFGQGWTQELFIAVEEDSTASTSRDSVRYYRPPKPVRLKTLNLYMTEYMVKSNLARLSYYAQGRYMDRYAALDEMFLQVNQFPEQTKNKMFAFAVAGGAAREVFKQTRKQLLKRKIRFIYPNLYGLNLTYPIRPLKANIHFRTISFADQYYGLSLIGGKAYLTFRQTSTYQQKGAYFKLYKNLRMFGLRSDYAYTSYNGLGLTNYSKKLFLYFIFLQNPERPEYNRTMLFMNLAFN